MKIHFLSSSMKEFVVLVDKNNRKKGIMEKLQAHKEGLLHRAFSIFVFNAKNELLLQQRAMEKYHCGGIWTNTVCSHPRPGETYHRAVHRRLMEEMGFDCKLKKLMTFVYTASFNNGLTENEYDAVFLGRFDKDPKLNVAEAMGFKWISLDDLRSEVKCFPEKYSPWLKIILGKVSNKELLRVL